MGRPPLGLKSYFARFEPAWVKRAMKFTNNFASYLRVALKEKVLRDEKRIAKKKTKD
jgi:hypothetical protein